MDEQPTVTTIQSQNSSDTLGSERQLEQVRALCNNKAARPVFIVLALISAVMFIGTFLVLYIDSYKFAVRERLTYSISSAGLVAVIYLTMLTTYSLCSSVVPSKRLIFVKEVFLLFAMACAQALFIAFLSAYHDTEIPLIACFCTCTYFILLAACTSQSKINFIGWPIYVTCIVWNGVVLAAEVIVLCLQAYCENIVSTMIASATATLASLYATFAVHMILCNKCYIITPTDWANAVILTYIFIPLLFIKTPKLCQNCIQRN